MNTIRLTIAGVALLTTAITLAACSALPDRPALTIAVTATSAEPAPDLAALSDVITAHADASLLPGDGEVTLVTAETITHVDITPMRGDDVENSESKRAEKIADNITALETAAHGLAAKGDGLDVIGVLDKALTATPAGGTVAMVTSGLGTVAPLDLAQAGDWIADPTAFVDATNTQDLPDATGKSIIFTGIGYPYAGSGQGAPGPAARTALETILTGLCEKMNATSCVIIDGAGGADAPASADAVPTIPLNTITTACVGELALDANVLFTGDSAALQPDADTELTPIANALAACPTSTIIDATGYTADTGCDNDPNDSAALAINRAQAILNRLLELGAPGRTIGNARNGGHLTDNCPNGTYNEAVATTNRTVILTTR